MALHCVGEENSLCLGTSSSQTVAFLQPPWEQKCANSPVFVVSLEVRWLERIFGWFVSCSFSPFFFLFISFLNSSAIIDIETYSAAAGFTVILQTLTHHWAWICPEKERIYFLMNRFEDDGGI